MRKMQKARDWRQETGSKLIAIILILAFALAACAPLQTPGA
jgi:hypothetical protein